MRNLHPLIIGIALLLAAGCAEKPKAIGSSLIDPNDVFAISDTVIAAISDTAYRVPLNGGLSTSNLTGRISPTEELISLYNFSDVGAIDSLIGARIDTAELRLYVNYSMTPSTPPIRFGVYEVLQSWSQASFTTDSMMSFSIGTVSALEFSDSMNIGADVKTSLDTNLVRRWINARTDTNAAPFYGFAVMAPPGAVTGVIGFIPFSSFSSVGPRLVIKYTKNDIHDSLVFTAGEDTYAARFSVPPVLSPFEVRGAFGVRSKVRFDLSSLTGKPIINNATMVITVDTANSVRSMYSPDSLIALLSLPGGGVDSSSTSFISIGTKKLDAAAGQTYQFNITTIAQRWVNALASNEGLSLRWAYETNTSDRVLFHTTGDADSAKRPKIKITYSRK